MKITGRPETAGKDAASNATQEKPKRRFSDVLEEKKQRGGEDGSLQVAPGVVVPLPPPFSPLSDVARVDGGQSVATAGLDPLLTSLIQEITVEAPPGGASSVEIQFDSRTLDGLHVRVQKAGEGVEVRFSTSSEAVSRLLSANADKLAEALVERGYVAPNVSVQRAQGPTAFSTSESGRSGRDGNSRGRQDQGRGRNRR
jgi:hypothetical protein